MKKIVVWAAVVVAVVVAAFALAVGGGVYNVAADEEHTAFVSWLLETARERSIAARAAEIRVPDLGDPQQVRRGAGNYDAMCAGCHLRPGIEKTEISAGLYPRPPDLTQVVQSDPARAFWIVKHGIKATGMPAWGTSMGDEHIWDMVAFVQKLPELSAEQYAEEIRSSGGHSHGGGESMQEGEDSESHDEAGSGHSHEDSGEHSHDAASSSGHTAAATAAGREGEDANDPVGVARRLHAALSSGDAAGVERLLAPDVLIMEGGNVERSRKEYASHHLQSDLKFMKQMSYKLERQRSDADGSLAWVASEGTLKGERDGKSVDIASTETLVLKKSAEGWRVRHIHWSSRNRS